MNITINNGNKGTAEIAVPNSLATKINEAYPEMAMMLAMEELSELSQAISKCIRNGSKDKRDNLAEEIVDVLIMIQWAINRFDIPLQEIQKWSDEKYSRVIERDRTDEVIFRSNEAKKAYDESRVAPNSLCISRIGKDGKYMLTGDIENLAEYFHVILTSLREKNKEYSRLMEKDDDMSQEEFEELMDVVSFSTDEKIREEAYAKISKYDINNKYNLENKSEENKLTKKQEKKNSKDLDKILEKASKKVKKYKKDSKKGKKGKK